MSATRIHITAFALLLGLLCPVSQPLPMEIAARPTCGPYQNGSLSASAQSMCDGKLLEAYSGLINQTFKLTKPLAIVGAQCGQANAFYDRGKSAIFVCYELWKSIVDRITRESRLDRNAQSLVAAGALSFVFLHELGHALIDHYNLPVLGREEDAADQIATFLLITMGKANVEVARYWPVGAHWFFSNSRMFFTRGHLSGEHSVDPQRQFNIACWIYGSDPNGYSGLAQYAKLPSTRAQKCPGEFQQMINAARQMLAPHLIVASAANRSSDASTPSLLENHGTQTTQRQGPSMAEKAATCHNVAQAKGLSGDERQSFLAECYRFNGVVTRQ